MAGLFAKARKYTLLILSAVVVALLIAACLILANVFDSTRSEVSRQTDTLGSLRIGQMRGELDAALGVTTDVLSFISGNTAATSFGRIRQPLSAKDHYHIYTIVNSFAPMRNIFAGNGIISDFAVYYPATDVLITSTSLYRPRNFFSSVYQPVGVGYDELSALLRGNVRGQVLPVPLRASASDEQWLYVQSMDNQATPAINVLLFLNVTRLRDMIRELERRETASSIFISFGGLTLGSGDAPEALAEVALSPGADGGEPPAGYERTQIASSVLRATRYHLYHASDSRASTNQAVEQFYSTALVVFLITTLVLLCILLAFLVPPTLRMVQQLRQDGRSRSDSIALAQQAVGNIIFRDKAAAVRLSGQWPRLKSAIVDYLTLDSAATLHDSLLMCNLMFHEKYYQAALLFFSGYGQDVGALVSELDARLANVGAAFRMDRRTLALILNAPDEGMLGYERMEALRDDMSKRLGARITACVGSVQESFDAVRQSYDDATRCLDYRVIDGDNVTICYEKHRSGDATYRYPLETELGLIAAVKSGDRKQVDQLLARLYEANFVELSLTPEAAQLLMSELITTAYKVLSDTDADRRDELLRSLRECRTVNEIFGALKSLFSTLCERREARRDADSPMRERLKQYVESHYADQDFSQSTMADDLHLTPNYVSALFKQHLGDTMIAYVTRLRVERATQLLRESDISIVDIATQVGFSGSNALSRAFKKQYGVTPSAYRQSVQGE